MPVLTHVLRLVLKRQLRSVSFQLTTAVNELRTPCVQFLVKGTTGLWIEIVVHRLPTITFW